MITLTETELKVIIAKLERLRDANNTSDSSQVMSHNEYSYRRGKAKACTCAIAFINDAMDKHNG